MDIFEALLTRRSVRKFQERPSRRRSSGRPCRRGSGPLPAETASPGVHRVTDREKIRQFDPKEHQPWVENAPAVIVVCANPHDTWEKYDEDDTCYILDTAAAIENMLLALHGAGLGAVWILTCGKRTIRQLLDIPKHWQIISIIPFGYCEEGEAGKLRPRKPLSEVAFLNDAQTPFPEES
jgi:nitroreductase